MRTTAVLRDTLKMPIKWAFSGITLRQIVIAKARKVMRLHRRTDMTDPISRRAEFNPLIRPYLVVTIGFSMVCTVVLAPLALFWFLGVGQWWARHYFDKLECELSERSIRFRKGILVSVEKTIPLENIQDVTFIEGPILRRFNLSTLKFETAGSSHDGMSNMQLTGIIDAADFRNQILAQRDALKQRNNAPQATPGHDAHLAALKIIIAKLDQIIAHQQNRR
jgi:membrane protein YdbS with pleckstrin-like domain